MSTSSTIRLSTVAIGLQMALTGAASAGDPAYFDRRDSITPGLGDAVARNQAIQTVDPWPAYVGRRKIDIDGDRIGLAVRRYKSNEVIAPKGLRTQSIISIGGNNGN